MYVSATYPPQGKDYDNYSSKYLISQSVFSKFLFSTCQFQKNAAAASTRCSTAYYDQQTTVSDSDRENSTIRCQFHQHLTERSPYDLNFTLHTAQNHQRVLQFPSCHASFLGHSRSLEQEATKEFPYKITSPAKSKATASATRATIIVRSQPTRLLMVWYKDLS